MKKVLIICAAGMSSSLMAKKTTEYFKDQERNIILDSTTVGEGSKFIEDGGFDLYLISPQAKMYFNQLKNVADRVGKPITNIPPQAYAPVPMGIEKLAEVILQELPTD